MKMVRLLSLSILLFSSSALALGPEELKARLSALKLPVQTITQSAIPGMFEVRLDGGQSLFVTEDGKHFLTGDLYEASDDGFINLSEESRSEHRREALAALDVKDMVVFSPPSDKVKATVSVFTDIDCGFCRKLHQEVPALNRMGIAVRYLAFPRSGPDTPSYDKIVSAWCADNPQEALTLAKLGQDIEPKTCKNRVAAQYELGNELGVTGTPSLIYEDGTLVPGYLPADQLARRLGVIN
ncbi:MAG: DsbC family protein [Pseudomonadota bacterium]